MSEQERPLDDGELSQLRFDCLLAELRIIQTNQQQQISLLEALNKNLVELPNRFSNHTAVLGSIYQKVTDIVESL